MFVNGRFDYLFQYFVKIIFALYLLVKIPTKFHPPKIEVFSSCFDSRTKCKMDKDLNGIKILNKYFLTRQNMRKYQQIKYRELVKIETYLNLGFRQADIAINLQRDASTISRSDSTDQYGRSDGRSEPHMLCCAMVSEAIASFECNVPLAYIF